jgi:DNA-binding MarR family transcriptional regulator
VVPADDQQPRWLNPAEEELWVALAGLLLKLPSALETDVRQRSGISHFEYLVISALSESPGRTLPMGDLATLASSTPSRLTHTVERLEARGWISRRRSPDNARFTLAHLTDEGFAFLVEAAPGYVATVRRFVFDALEGDDVERFRLIAQRILTRLDPDHEWPPRGTRHGWKDSPTPGRRGDQERSRD